MSGRDISQNLTSISVLYVERERVFLNTLDTTDLLRRMLLIV